MSKDYLLVSCWDDAIDQFIVKLVRICDGKELYKWTPDILLLNKQWNTNSTGYLNIRRIKNSTRLLHPLLLNDGSLIIGGDGLFKLDINSKIVWSTQNQHHSIERGDDGNFWICGYDSISETSQKYKILDDVIQKVSSVDGEILFEKSVFSILMENEYNRGILFLYSRFGATSAYLDCLHLNDVQPVLSDSRYCKKGDLFISLRNHNLVFLYRPLTNRIIWSQTGPWLRQHDVDVIDSSRIGVFGNNVIDYTSMNKMNKLVDGHNNQYIYDFSTNESSTPYDSFFKSANISTISGGQSRVLNNGDIFIEDDDHGKLLYGTYNEETWSYIQRIDNNRISSLHWCRYITEEEFNQFTFLNKGY